MWPFVRLTWRDVPRFVWLMLTTPVERELQGSLGLCRQRNAELLAEQSRLVAEVSALAVECEALHEENATLRDHLQRVIGERDAFDTELHAKETACVN